MSNMTFHYGTQPLSVVSEGVHVNGDSGDNTAALQSAVGQCNLLENGESSSLLQGSASSGDAAHYQSILLQKEREDQVSRNKLDVMRHIWHTKSEDLRSLMAKLNQTSKSTMGMLSGTAGAIGRTPESKKDVFDLILELFVDDPREFASNHVIEVLEAVFAEYPQDVEYFIPQLTIYLLYGSFARGELLKASLLRMCRESLTFALRLHWFLKAFCLSEAGVESEGVYALLTLANEIEANGEVAAKSRSCDSVSDSSDDSIALAPTSRPEHSTYPLHLTKSPPFGTSRYSQSLRFWHDMVEVSRALGALEKTARNGALRRMLHCTDAYLPSATIHVPFGNSKHRIWAVHSEECFAFSSKDRAPVLLCLEVLCYGDFAKREATRKWWAPRLSTSKPPRSSSIRAQPSVISGLSFGSNSYRALRNTTSVESLDVLNSPVVQSHEQGQEEPLTTGSSFDPHTHYGALIIADGKAVRAPEQLYTLDIGQWTSPSLAEMRRFRRGGGGGGDVLSTVGNNPSASTSVDRNNLSGSSYSDSLTSTAVRSNRDLRSELELEANTISAASSFSNANHIAYRPLQSFPKPEVLVSESSAAYSLSSSAHPGHLSESEAEASQLDLEASVVFKERWRLKEKRIRETSPIGHLDGWRLVPVIVKANDDLRQEQCAAQLIQLMHDVLMDSKYGSGLRPYDILAMSPDSGIIEAIPDTVSLHALRSKEFGYESLLDFFQQYFGCKEEARFRRAQDNFIKSLADYCIVCYVLQIKDRHNGNILITTHGKVVHIDFGFLLGKTPGGNLNFESAPFKLTADFVDVMGGENCKAFRKFRKLCVKSFMSLRKHHHRIVLLLEMMSKGNEHLPFFAGDPKRVIDEMRQRFFPSLHDIAAKAEVNRLIDSSLDNWTTTCYDRYQKCFVGVF